MGNGEHELKGLSVKCNLQQSKIPMTGMDRHWDENTKLFM